MDSHPQSENTAFHLPLVELGDAIPAATEGRPCEKVELREGGNSRLGKGRQVAGLNRMVRPDCINPETVITLFNAASRQWLVQSKSQRLFSVIPFS